MSKTKKGFTLIELLIVITIIGILAVAFVPTLLNAPSKGRDAQRIANLQSIQKALSAGMVEGIDYPGISTCLSNTSSEMTNLAPVEWTELLPKLGGQFPVDPNYGGTSAEDLTVDTVACTTAAAAGAPGTYVYVVNPGAGTTYSYGLYTKLENADSTDQAISCSDLDQADEGVNLVKTGVTDDNACYAILVE